MILKTLSVIAITPLVLWAVEPTNPISLCERYIKPEDQKECESKIVKDELDWYAAGVCEQQKEDVNFKKCWEFIKDKHFSAKALESCDDEVKLSDEDRMKCLQQASQRSPGSVSPYQSKQIQKK